MFVDNDRDPLGPFHEVTRRWFTDSFDAPTEAQTLAWPLLSTGDRVLLLAPTGSGKTLAAFLFALDRLMFGPPAPPGVKLLYISPLKALGVDIERNLRIPLQGLADRARREEVVHQTPTVGIRSGDTPAADRARWLREPPDILITTPESLFLMLTSKARETLAATRTVIVDEIHSLAAAKRGVHLFLSLERLEALRLSRDPNAPRLQRIGLSATQRPPEVVARLLGGYETRARVDAVPSNPSIAAPTTRTSKKRRSTRAESSDSSAPVSKSEQIAMPVDQHPVPRKVVIADASVRRPLDIRVETPVDDMGRLRDRPATPRSASAGPPMPSNPPMPSIWPSVYPRLVELIRANRSTMIFVNNRRLAERLAGAINDLAGEELALAHHGSIAKEARATIEERLKGGDLRAIVATSSLELGIDMGAVDLVIQIEAPPSIATGIQRVGRSSHHVGGRPKGVLIPKYRGDLLASAAAARRMSDGEIEETKVLNNPLDVLAQQIAAIVSVESMSVERLYALVRQAAPYAELPRSAFEGVLDLLSGRFPTDQLHELKALIVWDRVEGTVSARRPTRRVVIVNAGVIPDRGHFGVFLASTMGETGAGETGARVGELDEEMVFETRPGDVFLLGASSWRVVDITHDRVLVTPAPGESGKMPFWRGDGLGRPLEFGRAIGELTRTLAELSDMDAQNLLMSEHGLNDKAARNLIEYVRRQLDATMEAPTDRTIVVESFLDEIGDWRVAILTPFGARIHAPWAIALSGGLRERTGREIDMVWSDDGILFRFPEADAPPPIENFFPHSDEIEDQVTGSLRSTALFAGRFRENAARALLLPKRQPGRRTPLWLRRRKSADLLAAVSEYPAFPILLETYRECLRDVFDLPGLRETLRQIETRQIRIRAVETSSPSPFASSLLFQFVANFLYEGDAPLAERRAQALSLDQARLRELLGDAEFETLLDAATIEQLVLELQMRTPDRKARHLDAVHDMLLRLGDLSLEEASARIADGSENEFNAVNGLNELVARRRIAQVEIAGERRYLAAEDVGRYRDALGTVPPSDLPLPFLESAPNALRSMVIRYARTHGPFASTELAARWGADVRAIESELAELARTGKVVRGADRGPAGNVEWCDADVWRTIKRRCLARLRRQIEPVDRSALCRFLPRWHGLHRPRKGLDSLLDAIETLQGATLPFSALERSILPKRVEGHQPGDLDQLCSSGEVVWRGVEAIGERDGWIQLFLADAAPRLAAPIEPRVDQVRCGPEHDAMRELLRARGALFFTEIQQALGGFTPDTLRTLWDLVWLGEVTNDTLVPLRALGRGGKEKRSSRRSFRSRRVALTPGTQGRWSLFNAPIGEGATTERQAALAIQLLRRHGVLVRAAVAREGIPGGFAGIYPVLKALEEAGKARRGYFVERLGGAQFAWPGAEEMLRRPTPANEQDNDRQVFVLAACDPANPFGVSLPWPNGPENEAPIGASDRDTTPLDVEERISPPRTHPSNRARSTRPSREEKTGSGQRPGRSAGAKVVLSTSGILGWLNRTGKHLVTFLPTVEEVRSSAAKELCLALAREATVDEPILLTRVDGENPGDHWLRTSLLEAGFVELYNGFVHRGGAPATGRGSTR